LFAQVPHFPEKEQVTQLGIEHPTHVPTPSTITKLNPDWQVEQELAKLQVVQLGWLHAMQLFWLKTVNPSWQTAHTPCYEQALHLG
jgi:hypothetical protein